MCAYKREKLSCGLKTLIKNSLPCSLVLVNQYKDVAVVWIESAHRLSLRSQFPLSYRRDFYKSERERVFVTISYIVNVCTTPFSTEKRKLFWVVAVYLPGNGILGA